MKLLLTGATGRLGAALRPLLLARDGVELVVSSRSEITDVKPGEHVRIGDLANLDDCRGLVAGVDGIVHLGGQAKEHTFETILQSNIVGTYNVFEAARQAGCPRILFASSVHAIGFHDTTTPLDATSEMRPDTLYGLSKCYGELLARLYWEKFGQESVSVRIGSSFERPRNARMLSTWLSHGDLARLVFATFEATRTGAAMVYGASDNAAGWWSNDHAGFLGWKPQDSADPWHAEFAGTGDPSDAASRFQGGPFATDGHFEDR